MREQHKDRYYRLKSLGVCANCQRPSKGFVLCEFCRMNARANSKRWQQQLKQEVINAYGNICNCCAEPNISFLTIDHMNNDGAAHRREVGAGLAFYRWLRNNNYPRDFQILCMNCNWARYVEGECPHKN